MASETTETLVFERSEHVGWLRLDRPDKLNAMTPRMWDEMRDLGRQLVDDTGLRCLVVTGNGRAFSAGIDTSTFGSEETAGDAAADRLHDDPVAATVLRIQESFTWLEDAPFPTIAAVRGHALGAGIQLALACDLRVVARGTRLGVLEQRYGILPDLGGTWWLPRLVGPAKAKELTWTAATIDAEEAYRIGLCERLVDDDELEEVAGDLAASIAAQPPLAVAGSKSAINRVGAGAGREEVLVETAEHQAVCLRSDDFGEAITAFLEGRAPVFGGE